MKGGKSKGKADNKLGVKKSAAQTKKEKNAAKDPTKPKRPASAFFVFMEDFRKQYKEKHPGNKSVAAVGKAGGEQVETLDRCYVKGLWSIKKNGERSTQALRNSNPSLKVQRFLPREIDKGTGRIGFEVVTLDGRKGLLASTKISSPQSLRWPTVGRYRVDVASFEVIGVAELQVREDTDLFIIDEIGKMELYSSSFFPAVLKVLQSNIPLLATIPITKAGRDLEGARVFTLDAHNRDAMREQICSIVSDVLQKPEDVAEQIFQLMLLTLLLLNKLESDTKIFQQLTFIVLLFGDALIHEDKNARSGIFPRFP
ncbi:hypothetical protein HAX54_041162 [Datura stramonium]|uniref:HMG box domain-containing protein n=1 Tax=Datura stramonium TaxID=4076 RepID=A0ABS8SKZ1_DATST|nr:hypothetical protein [Datura stramonium]